MTTDDPEVPALLVCPAVDWLLVVTVFVVGESEVDDSVVMEFVVVGLVVVVGGGVVVHGPEVHEGLTGTLHWLVDVQSVSVMSSEIRQQSALKYSE